MLITAKQLAYLVLAIARAGAGSTFDKDTNQCINDLTYCQNTEGANATYNATTNSCGCAIGYAYSGGSCVVDNGYSVCAAMNATWDGSSYTSSGGIIVRVTVAIHRVAMEQRVFL